MDDSKPEAERARQLDEQLCDLSGVIASALGSLALVRRGLSHPMRLPPSRLRALVEDAIEAGELAARLTLELRGAPTRPSPVCSLASALDQAIAIARPHVVPPAFVTRRYREDPVVAVHATVLVRIFSHLLVNAARATDPMRPRNEIVVRTHTRGETVVVSIRDHGTGLPTTILEQLETGVAPAPGAPRVGSGLTSVTHLLELCRGSLSLHSEPGRGTIARVALPLIPEPGEAR